MPPDRWLTDATPGETPNHEDVQQLVEAESGQGSQGVRRAWLASDAPRLVLTSDGAGVKISRDNGTTPPAQVVVDGTPAGGSLSGTYPNPGISVASQDAMCPPGVIMLYAGAGVPTGWLACDGSPFLRTTFPRLFAAIGTTWGASGGATTFNVPDLRGMFLLGSGGSRPLAAAGGAETAAGPAHTHPGSHSHDLNNHSHDISGHHHDIVHAHTLSGHHHVVNLDHDHPLRTETNGALSSGSTLNGRFTAGGANALPDNHTHDVVVNLPPLGLTNATSGVPDADATATMAATNSGNSSAPTTGAATGTTAADSSAPAASYGATTIPTMPPFRVLTYIIRAY